MYKNVDMSGGVMWCDMEGTMLLGFAVEKMIFIVSVCPFLIGVHASRRYVMSVCFDASCLLD